MVVLSEYFIQRYHVLEVLYLFMEELNKSTQLRSIFHHTIEEGRKHELESHPLNEQNSE